MNLIESIQEIASRKLFEVDKEIEHMYHRNETETEVSFAQDHSIMRTFPFRRIVYDALQKCSERERFCLIMEIFKLWIKPELDRPTAEAIFGKILDFKARALKFQLILDDQTTHIGGDKGLKNTLLTLTQDGRQLRVWFSPPWGMGRQNHVDSAGVGLLFHVVGHPERVKMYLDAMLRIIPSPAMFQLPNGNKFYLEWPNQG